MSTKFLAAAAKLVEANERFSSGQIKPVQHRDLREFALGAALMELATEFGVSLQQPLHVDANGEFNIVAMPIDGRHLSLGAGPFGDGFAKLLNRHSPRTGISAGAMLLPENGWCKMNHFDVEKMVLEHMEQSGVFAKT